MIKKISILLALFVSLNLSAQKRISIQALTNVNDVYTYKNKPYTGLTVELHKNKKIAQQITWVHGKMNGLRTEWFEQGKNIIKSKVNFKNNKRHGDFTVWYGKNKKKIQGKYSNNNFDGRIERWYVNGLKQYVKNYKNGVKHGQVFNWFPTGSKQQEGNFINGNAHGTFLTWYPKGKLRKKETFKNGYLNGKFTMWHFNGKIAESSNYSNGLAHGKKESWGIRGGKISEENYSLGKKHGKWVSFGLTGDTLTLNQYKLGKLHGKQRVYSKRQIESETEYINGLKTGLWRTGLISGKGKRIGNYKNDKRIGEWVFYDLDGKILIKITYDNNGNKVKDEKF